MFLGLWLYGYSLSVLAATLANQDAPRVRFLEKIIALKEFMLNQDLPKDLQTLVSRDSFSSVVCPRQYDV